MFERSCTGRLAVLAATVLLLFSAMLVIADSIDFNFQSGTLSYTSTGVVPGTPELQVARKGTVSDVPSTKME
jgi:hypothetical protein